jgi:leader peptidase (prepilin peptidase)/N-methyltransferase
VIAAWVLFASLIAALGLAVGSFLNVVAYRVPLGLSVVAPPSACPGCGSYIEARDNIPILSWLILRGRCRHCAEPISVRYLVLEAITGMMFVVVAAAYLPPLLGSVDVATAVSSALVLVAMLYFAAISVALSAIDIETHRLPNAVVLPAYAVGALCLGAAGAFAGDWVAIARAAAGAGILVLFYFLLAVVKPGGMGMGDVKLAGVIGLFLGFLGWGPLVVGVFSAFLLGGVFGLGLIIARRAGRASGVPFGPWMFAGAWVGALFGEALTSQYMQLVGLL